MGKRQRSHTSEDADTCKGKRISGVYGRPTSTITSPLLTVSESSQSDNEVDIVWGHSPPPLNLNLRTTPGPKTRRKSDYTNKDIADMIECIHSRNSSQQSPTISTPPLLGLWMQGRQDVEMTPAGAKSHRLSRKLPSRKPSVDSWASLAKDLHMLAEASKDFPMSQQPAEIQPEGDLEEVVSCQTFENLDTEPVPECQNISMNTPQRIPLNQNDGASEDSPMAELWGDDSWFETDSIVRIATQVEEQEASKKLEGTYIDTNRTVSGNKILQTVQSADKHLPTNNDKNASKGFMSAISNTVVSSAVHSNHQFTSPPNCRRLSRKQMIQKPPECNLNKENSSKERSSFHFSGSKESVGLKKEGLQQFTKQSNHVRDINRLKIDSAGNTKEALVRTTQRGQFVKDSKSGTSGTNACAKTVSVSSVDITITPNASLAGTENSKKTFNPVEEVLDNCNESMDLFEASLVDEEVENEVKGQENIRNKEVQHAKKDVNPLGNTNKLDCDLSDLSFIDEELLAAVELEEMHWEEVSSQHDNKVVKASKTNCTDNGAGYQHSFAVPHPVENARNPETESSVIKTIAPASAKRSHTSQFSFKSSQKSLQKQMTHIEENKKIATNTGMPVPTQQVTSQFSEIVDHENRMNQMNGKHAKSVNQFSHVTTDRKLGKQFEKIYPAQFSSSQSVQFQQKKPAAKVENNISVQNVKLVPTTSNGKVPVHSSNMSPFKAHASSQFERCSTSGPLKNRVIKTDSLPLSEKDTVNSLVMKKQTVQPAKSAKVCSSLAEKDGCSTIGTGNPNFCLEGKNEPETVSTNNGGSAAQTLRRSRDTFQFGKKLPNRKENGHTVPVPPHLSQFQSGSKERKDDNTSSSNLSNSRINLREENKSDASFISKNPLLTAFCQFQTKPSTTSTLSANQVTSNSDLNSSVFSHVSSQFSTSSQVRCNDTCSEVTPSPVFTTHSTRPSVIGNNGTVSLPLGAGTSRSTVNRHLTDNSKSLPRKEEDEEIFSTVPVNSRSLHHNQFSQFSKVKKEHSVVDNLLEGESLLVSGKHSKEVNNLQATAKEKMQDNHSVSSDVNHVSNLVQKNSSQFVKAGSIQSQSNPVPAKSKPVLTSVTNMYSNDGKHRVVSGCAKQFSKVSRTLSAPNGEVASDENKRTECAETRKDNLKSSQKAEVIVNSSSTVKSSQGSSNEYILKPQNQLHQPRTNTVSIALSQDKRPCSQEQIEQKRREALARKKRRENLIGNHSMNLRERTILKK